MTKSLIVLFLAALAAPARSEVLAFGDPSADGLSVSPATVTVTGTGPGCLQAGTTALYVDCLNKRVGINRNGATATLHVSSGQVLVEGSGAGMNVVGPSTATYFYGNGSALTGIATGTGTHTDGGNASFNRVVADQIVSTGTAPSLTATGGVFTASVTAPVIGGPTGSLVVASTTSLWGNLGIGTASPSKKLHVSSGVVMVDGTGGQFKYEGDAGAMALVGTGGGRGLYLDSTYGALLTGVGSAAVPYFQANVGAANLVAAGGSLVCETSGCTINGTSGVATRGLAVYPRVSDNFGLSQSTTNSMANLAWGIDKFAHVVSSAAGVGPSIGTCTNGAVLGGSTDTSGRVTFSGANSSCSITFAYAAVPAQTVNCAVSTNMATPALANVTATGTTLTVVASSFANNDYFSYVCYRNGGTY